MSKSENKEYDYGCYCDGCPFLNLPMKCSHSDTPDGGFIIEWYIGNRVSGKCPAE